MASPEEFTALVEKHQSMVFRTLARLTGRTGSLEDLAQEVFLRLWRGLPHFRGDAQVTTYLYRITVNVAQEEWKRRKRRMAEISISDPGTGWDDRLAAPGPNAAEMMTRNALQAEVEAALLTLNDRERNALVLFHQEGRSYQELAEILKLPLNTVRTYLHRGRERLRCAIQERMKEVKR